MKDEQEYSGKLADDHWDWIEMLLESFKNIEIGIDTLSFVYTTALMHGFKHGVEYAKERKQTKPNLIVSKSICKGCAWEYEAE